MITKHNNQTDNLSLDVGRILGIKVNSTPKVELLKLVNQRLEKKIPFDIVTPNPEIILQAQSDPELAHSLNSADFSIPDGFGLKIGNPVLQIIKGRQFMLDLFEIANNKKLKIYLLGSTDKVIKKSLVKLKVEYPNLIAKGNSGPWLNNNAVPVSEVDSTLQFEIVKEINSFKPDLLFVAFGAPKQEIWINKYLKDLKVTGAMTVGGALDYYSGFVKPVPTLFTKLNLEWFWRLIQEPARISRVFNALIIFPFKLAIDKIF
jgi:N-acetylglucosaminyldiphosphoundecaprenol N-acetyl-beta-D-mannosaminyltransferase